MTTRIDGSRADIRLDAFRRHPSAVPDCLLGDSKVGNEVKEEPWHHFANRR